jgi:hypothetical protein
VGAVAFVWFQGPPSPDQLAAIGALVGASAADMKLEMASCFEALTQSITGAVREAMDVGPARLVGVASTVPVHRCCFTGV